MSIKDWVIRPDGRDCVVVTKENPADFKSKPIVFYINTSSQDDISIFCNDESIVHVSRENTEQVHILQTMLPHFNLNSELFYLVLKKSKSFKNQWRYFVFGRTHQPFVKLQKKMRINFYREIQEAFDRLFESYIGFHSAILFSKCDHGYSDYIGFSSYIDAYFCKEFNLSQKDYNNKIRSKLYTHLLKLTDTPRVFKNYIIEKVKDDAFEIVILKPTL